MATETMQLATGPDRAHAGEVTGNTESEVWRRPEYVVVETALEVTAYSLSNR